MLLWHSAHFNARAFELVCVRILVALVAALGRLGEVHVQHRPFQVRRLVALDALHRPVRPFQRKLRRGVIELARSCQSFVWWHASHPSGLCDGESTAMRVANSPLWMSSWQVVHSRLLKWYRATGEPSIGLWQSLQATAMCAPVSGYLLFWWTAIV